MCLKENKDLIPGGLSKNKSIKDIAKHHNISISNLENQLRLGIKVEKEHTYDLDIAREIAMDHLYEDPHYYTKLSKIETNEIFSKNWWKFSLNEEIFSSYKLELINEFIDFACKILDIPCKDINIEFTDDKSKTKTYAHFDPNNNSILVYTKNRNLGDILRSLCHELVHFKQKLLNKLTPFSGKTGSKEENQANSIAGIILREFGSIYPEIFE